MNHDIFKPLWDLMGLPYPGAYMTMLYFGFLCSFPILIVAAKKQNLSVLRQLLLPVTIIPTALVFSRIFHILFEGMFFKYMDGLKENGISYLFTVMLNPFAPGHVFYGGLLGGFVAGALTTMINYPKNWESFKKTADVAAVIVANGLWLARIGCFLEGCCFGKPSDLFGISFPQGSRTMFLLYKIDPEYTSLYTDTQPIIPTQLVHSVSNLIICGILVKLMFTGKEKNPGYVASIYLLLYPLTRFMIEFLRYDTRGSFLFLSTSQWISIIVFFAGLKLYRYTKNS
ncbi:MAG TPA: prolipoprotein diacylglyceryl transferase [bacterium]|jgi:phosphatidylglycerol:prolipoprotein diacylglycerol transferase|nr:prolipoprotein diacylglyceryl transferase [bacterium]HOG42910.1 prolipoprotein diacylglyceryl transferase [bacterium]HPG36391.1 prolipoprotein diacylglyceryl transferase [bacterium]HPM47062.1 prolipoprotein diacylglyceryl transferase [bacterium]